RRCPHRPDRGFDRGGPSGRPGSVLRSARPPREAEMMRLRIADCGLRIRRRTTPTGGGPWVVLALVAFFTLFVSSAAAQQALRDITGIEGAPPAPPPVRWPYWLAIGIASTAGVCLVGWRWGRGRPAGRSLSPDRWALAELDRIAALGLPETGEAERFHTLVSDVIRRYLELRFDLRAPQRTTPEFLRSLGEQSPLPAERQ